MDDRLFAAHDVTKTNSTRVETFQAPERGPVAIADPEGLFFRHPSPERERAQFDVASLRELPRVDIVYAYPGVDSVAVDALVAAGARGLVVAGVGRGGVPPGMRPALARARARGVVVVVATRTGSGRVPETTGDGYLGAGELNAPKARVLLTLALTRASSESEVARIFARNQ